MAAGMSPLPPSQPNADDHRSERLISVIIPAYNSADTLTDTLNSVLAQTHSLIEVIVVDDGSTDNTFNIAREYAASDPRVRVIQQANGGVAKARNTAISVSTADLIAPIDADDLWHPAKLERQLDVLKAFPNIGLVYTWFAKIDRQGRIIEFESRHTAEGNVLAELCVHNIVGHASSPLVTRAAIEHAGGYDETLRARNAQGCEDNKLYLAIAEHYNFAVVKEHLVGYREMPEGMSSDFQQMLRSRDLCIEETVDRHPALVAIARRGRFQMLKWMLLRALRSRMYRLSSQLLFEMLQTAPTSTAAYIMRFVFRRLTGARRATHDPMVGKPFVQLWSE